MVSFVFVALVVAGAVGYFTRGRGGRPGVYGPLAPGRGGYDDRGQGGAVGGAVGDARAEARHWVGLLGAGLSGLDGVAAADEDRQRAARFALSDAAERHTAATEQLGEAGSVHQIQLATRTALEGLHYLRAARTALGLDPGPDVPSTAATGELIGSRRVTVEGQEFEASGQPGQRTPYYYPGGTVRGRNVPAGWYSTPWWKTALIAGGAGLGSLLVLDALFGQHGGGFGGHGGFGGDHFGGMDHMAGPMGGGGFMDGDGGWF